MLLDVVELQVAHDVGVVLVLYYLQLGIFKLKVFYASFSINNTAYLGVLKLYGFVFNGSLKVNGVALLL